MAFNKKNLKRFKAELSRQGKKSLLLCCAFLLFGCENGQELFDFGQEEEIKTVVQTQWSKDDQVGIFDRLGMQVEKLNLENPFSEEENEGDSEDQQPADQQTADGKITPPKMENLEVEPLPSEAAATKENFLASAQTGKKVDSIPAVKAPSASAKQAKAPFKEPVPSFSVQVGAFQKKGNSETLVKRLDQRGYQAKMIPVKDFRGREWFTVRIGKSENVDQAILTAKKFSRKEGRKSVILKNDLIYQVISPDKGVKSKNFFAKKEQPIQPKANAKKSAARTYAFQVGGLFMKAKADTLAKELQRRGYKPSLKKVQDLHRQSWWYQVEIGYYHTKEEAGNAAIRFAEQELMPTMAP